MCVHTCMLLGFSMHALVEARDQQWVLSSVVFLSYFKCWISLNLDFDVLAGLADNETLAFSCLHTPSAEVTGINNHEFLSRGPWGYKQLSQNSTHYSFHKKKLKTSFRGKLGQKHTAQILLASNHKLYLPS